MQKTKTIQIYEVVQAKTVNDLVRLVNLKTKFGWIATGGVAHVPNNYSDTDSEYYPFFQAVTKRIRVKIKK